MTQSKGVLGGLFGKSQKCCCCNMEITEEPEEEQCCCNTGTAKEPPKETSCCANPNT